MKFLQKIFKKTPVQVIPVAPWSIRMLTYTQQELDQLAHAFAQRGLNFNALYTEKDDVVVCEYKDSVSLCKKLEYYSHNLVVSSLLRDDSSTTAREKVADYYTIREAMFQKPLEDMPLLIEHPVLSLIAKWRLAIAK
jgi:hypothetical protein